MWLLSETVGWRMLKSIRTHPDTISKFSENTIEDMNLSEIRQNIDSPFLSGDVSIYVSGEEGVLPVVVERATKRSTPMPQRAATIESLPMAFEVVKEMQADGLEWGEGYRPLGRRALAEIIEGRMAEAVDYWLDHVDASAMRDRRNGSYSRHLLTELGDIEISVPRTRRFCPSEVVRSYARRAPEIDRAILAGFVLGLSTRKVGLTYLTEQCSVTTMEMISTGGLRQ